jgi:hypothetical protein
MAMGQDTESNVPGMEIVADRLGVGPVNDADGPFELRVAQTFQGVVVITQDEQKAGQSHLLE